MMLVQSLTTFSLMGLIWIVQLVHYPSFRFIDEHRFEAFHKFHSKYVSFIVVPFMIAEFVSAAWLTIRPESRDLLQIIMLGLVLVVWCSTFFLQVPIHNQLKNGKDDVLIKKLVAGNWLRTVAWTIKACLVVWITL